MRLYALFIILTVLTLSIGCHSQSKSLEGAADYSLNGKAINPPNQVRVENPYSFAVWLEWQDKEVTMAAHSVRLILFEGMSEPGPVRVFKADMNGNKIADELTYVANPAGPFNKSKVYRIQ